ncbi:MAG: sugar phosphate isomerase/epimerase [Phycisphaerales bacterium]|jgi:sugar phosphate isomerase/epimerase
MLTRRQFSKLAVAATVAPAALAVGQPGQPDPKPSKGMIDITPKGVPTHRMLKGCDALGWTLGCQSWTFRDRTVFESVETMGRLGLTHAEFYPGQKLAPHLGDAKIDAAMPAEQVKELQDHLAKHGVTANSWGVIAITKDEKANHANFEFAKKMGMHAVSCEPEREVWDMAASIGKEYQICLAIHNHPKPSTFWTPDVELEAFKGREEWIGSCSDVGHWPRSGLNSLDCLKKLDGHIFELHFKDVAKVDDKPTYEDRPWGTGGCDAKGMMAELKRQKFKGVFLVEYEITSGKELEENVAKSIAFFDKTAMELAKA